MNATNHLINVRCHYFATMNSNNYGTEYKIDAIRELRNLTGLGLRDAKDIVEGQTTVYFNESIAETLRTSRFFHVQKMEVGLCFVEPAQPTTMFDDAFVVKPWRMLALKLMGIISVMYDDVIANALLDVKTKNSLRELANLASTSTYEVTQGNLNDKTIKPRSRWSF